MARARGSPLYVEEAVATLADGTAGEPASGASLPPSLPELLIRRIRATLVCDFPQLERQYQQSLVVEGYWFLVTTERQSLLARLDALEEPLAAWLDRVDVVDDHAPALVRAFLEGLAAADGRLALLSLFLGRQRPHASRLARPWAASEPEANAGCYSPRCGRGAVRRASTV